jgi:hypothetical protein
MCSVPLPGICPEYVGDARPSVSGMVWRSSRWRRLQRSTARTASSESVPRGRPRRACPVRSPYNHIKRGGNFQLRLTTLGDVLKVDPSFCERDGEDN